jgi:hypothetical protein
MSPWYSTACWIFPIWAAGVLNGWSLPAAQHLEVTGRHRLTLTYVYTAVWPRGGRGLATFYLPVPPTTGCQQIEAFSSNLHGSAASDSDTPSRRILHGIIRHASGDERRLQWRVQVTGTFETRQLVSGPPTGPVASVGAGSFLGNSESIDWKSDAFQGWLDDTGLRRESGESPVAFGRRLYDYLVDHGRYEYPPRGGWIASGAARRLRTDCGGFSLVFTAACRANHIPARLLAGQWFKTRKEGGGLEQTGKQSHVIAEFYDPAIGWIPEDVTSTLMRVPGHGDFDYFGREPGYFFTWHFDTDLPPRSISKATIFGLPAPNASAIAVVGGASRTVCLLMSAP